MSAPSARIKQLIKLRASAELELRRRARQAATGTDARQLPPWADEFQRPAQYKVAYGGRGSAKSHTFARMLIMAAAERPLRILCARELQVSIKDSVHRLLSDLVDAMGLTDQFDIGQTHLRAYIGSEFIFKGLRHNSNEIKSTEGIDIAWVEEADSVSDRSWEALLPTIRAPGSETWISFNPDQETDPTYHRFIVNTPPNSIVRKVNWSDNPWFPPELESQRAYLARVDPDAYRHVWEGECRNFSDAQVLKGKWIVDAFDPSDDWSGPYYGADWGFAKDPSALVRCWIHGRTLYIDHEAYGVEVALDDLPTLFASVPGARQHLIRADSARPETINHLASKGLNIVGAPKWAGSVEDGVEFLRSFERIVIHERCKHTSEEARLWSYKTDRLTGDVLPILVDAHNHLMDSIRYALAPLIRNRRGEFWLPDAPEIVTDPLAQLHQKIQSATPVDPVKATCGRCTASRAGLCNERGFVVQDRDPGCELFIARAA